MTSLAQILQYHEPAGLVSISSRVARKMRGLKQRMKTWPTDHAGYGDDARRWAEKSMADLLRHMADNLKCDLSDTEIGGAEGGAA